MRRVGAAAAASIAALAGCGGEAGDLLAIAGSGGARPDHEIVVTGDGRGRCDGGDLSSIESDRLIEAREIEREVEDLANDSREYMSVPERRRYVMRTNDGTLRWSEGSPGLPEELPRAALLALQLERELC